jgi:hypothetical protein
MGPDHSRTSSRLRALGTCLAAQGQYAEAVERLEHAVERAEAIHGVEDERTRATRAELARVGAAAEGR